MVQMMTRKSFLRAFGVQDDYADHDELANKVAAQTFSFTVR